MSFRQENYAQEQGESKLELRGGALEIALFVDGAPLIYDAADCSGSIGRFTALLENARPDITAAIESAANSGFAENIALSEHVAPLLALMPAGKYALTLAPMREGSLHYAFDDYVAGTHLGYFPYAHLPGYQIADVYLGTQPESSLHDAVINRYLDAIDGGARPALISLGAKDHVARFVLDGHHKWMAYWCCGVTPVILHIEAEKMAPISCELAEQLLANASALDKSAYLGWKQKTESSWLSRTFNI